MKIKLDIRHHSEIPEFKGERHASCLILNPCDGWHVAFLNFYEDGDFEYFSNFTQEHRYAAGEFFVAWCELPDELKLLKELAA